MGCYERDWGKVTNEKNGGQGNKRALKEKEIEVSVEIVLKKIEGYVIKNYLYLINVEVSRSINFNRQSTDKLPTDYQQWADMLLTVGRLLADRSLKLWKKLSADSWLTVGRAVGRQSVEVSCSSQLPTCSCTILTFLHPQLPVLCFQCSNGDCFDPYSLCLCRLADQVQLKEVRQCLHY